MDGGLRQALALKDVNFFAETSANDRLLVVFLHLLKPYSLGGGTLGTTGW